MLARSSLIRQNLLLWSLVGGLPVDWRLRRILAGLLVGRLSIGRRRRCVLTGLLV